MLITSNHNSIYFETTLDLIQNIFEDYVNI